MPLPSNFSPAEHLQDALLNIQNKIVRLEFNDVGDDAWERDISTPRGSLRTACTHQEDDSLAMTQLRLDLFYLVLRKAKDYHPNIYGIPSLDFQERMTYFPQVQLHFEEKYAEADPGYDILRNQISFRIVGETSQSFSLAEATTIANKIKALFNPGDVPFFWRKGKELYTYIDQSKGYYFQIYAFDEANAKKIIEQVLDIKSHSPDWGLLNSHRNDQPTTSYPIVPPPKTILGKSRKQPRKRPVGTVRFIYAELHLHGLGSPLILYDPDKRHSSALLR